MLVSCLALPAAADEPRGLPATPASIVDLVLARPFSLERGYVFDWNAERPLVRSGVIVVLKVDPALVVPRNAAEPILYAGDTTVQRLNQGQASGTVIGIIPKDVDLTQTPIWFGTPGLPERVTAETILSERALAEKAGIKSLPARAVQAATRARLSAPDLASLLRDHVANLVLEYAPQEKSLAETWRLPEAVPPAPRQTPGPVRQP
jgi:hypothetical protein